MFYLVLICFLFSSLDFQLSIYLYYSPILHLFAHPFLRMGNQRGEVETFPAPPGYGVTEPGFELRKLMNLSTYPRMRFLGPQFHL